MTAVLSAYTLALLKPEVQFLTGDVGGTRFTSGQNGGSDQLADSINFAIKMLVGRMGYTYTEAKIKAIAADATFPYGSYFPLLKTGTGAYDYRDYIEIRRAAIGYAGDPATSETALFPLNKTTLAQEDMNFSNWRNLTGIPQRWALWQGNAIAVFKLPASSIGSIPYYWTLTIGYVQQPALLSSANDTVDSRIPTTVQQYLKYAAASWLLALDQSDAESLQTSKIYMDTFLAYLGG
jgi:hypothetical protein